VCLPGGKRDASDPDDGFTAKREAWEEMGLAQDDVQVVVSLLPGLVSRSGSGAQRTLDAAAMSPR
jgi:8-oxo-dGTP pyrophosphatase MutT (NUDIX family)